MSINDAAMRQLLTKYRRVAVVGLSDKTNRPSYVASKYMLEHGFEVIPVNPGHKSIMGLTCYPDLRSIPTRVDIVDLFQRAERVPLFVDDAIAIGARVLWMQLDIVNEAAAAKAREAGLEVVMDRCIKIEYARLF